MEFATEAGDLIGAFEGRKDKANEGVLDKLKAVKSELGKVEE